MIIFKTTLSWSLFALFLSCMHVHAELLKEGDNCTNIATNEKGLCTNVHNCDYARTLLRQHKIPQLCGFTQTVPLVCCPIRKKYNTSAVGEISRFMCKTYNDIRNQIFYMASGTRALSKEFQHMAAVGFVDNDTHNILWLCGGSLISHYFILTAAHCVYSQAFGPAMWIRLGDLDLIDTTEDADPQNIKISQYHVHPLYKSPSYYHDVALFKLENYKGFNLYIFPACLHTERTLPINSLEAIGWGRVGLFGNRSSHLMKANLQMVNHDICKRRYTGASTRKLKSGIMDQYQLCAGDESGRDTCPGDSGGPLHYNSHWIRTHFVVAGISSFGKGCGGRNTIGVYTRVSTYVGWIENIVWSEPELKSNELLVDKNCCSCVCE